MPLDIAFFEDLSAHDAIRIDHDRARVRQPLLVLQPQTTNDAASFIGQQRKGNFLFVAKLFQDVEVVIANGNKLKIVLFELS